MKSAGILFLVGCVLSFAHAEEIPSQEMLVQEEPQHLVVHNRILAKVQGKTISVVDVMKKMEVFLSQTYPHLVHSQTARYQFFSTQWKPTLAQMIDTELMLADAEHLGLKVTDAEVREEILQRFGPNVMQSLDKLGMTYEEARTLVHSEMVVQRMQWYRVTSKALQRVGPQDIKGAYRDFVAKNPSLEEWLYQVLSIRSSVPKLGEEVAHRMFHLLQDQGTTLAAMGALAKEEDPNVSVSISEEQKVNERTIAESHRHVLSTLAVGSYSEPISQVSRTDGSIVYRIFHLKEHSKTQTPAFGKMADTLREDLIQKAFTQENALYITKLREKLGYDETLLMGSVPADFQPFSLK